MKKILIFILLFVFLITPIFSQYTIDDYKEAMKLLVESNEKLIEYSEELEGQVELLRNSLITSNEMISELKDQVKKDKEEILVLREQIKNVFTQLDEDRNNTVGLGISYPLGVSFYYSIRPKNFPVGGFVFSNFDKSLSVSVGATYSF